MTDHEDTHKVTQGLPHEGEVHEFQPDPQSTIDYLRSIAPHKKKHTGRRVMITLLVLVLLGGGGFGAYWLYIRPKPAPTSKKVTPIAVQAETIPTATKHHTSTTFNLEFDYPENWTISEVTGSGQMIARSPRLQLKGANNKTVNGQVVFTIRDKNQALNEFTNGNAVAVIESEKLDYAKPSSTQRGATYLSFLRYATNSNSASLDGVYVTGDTGYQVGQAIPKADFTPVDPIITVTFATCANQECTGSNSGTPLAIVASSWTGETLSKPIKTMLASLVVN
jgi:hypothetical protein